MGAVPKNMLRPVDRLRYAIKRYKGITIETDRSPYNRVLNDILSVDLSHVPDVELKNRIDALKKKSESGDLSADMLPKMYAAVREAANRTLGITPFGVQIMAGIALHQGKLAQMRTGEGKTLAAVFPATLNALTGRGVHILTANEYLAKRDAQWMGDI